MSQSSLIKLRGLLISACEASKDGHSDISASLMEFAKETLEEVSPEDIESSFHVVENKEIYEEYDDEIEDSDLKGSALASILSEVGVTNK